MGYKNTLDAARPGESGLFETLNINRFIGLSRSFVSWKWRMNARLTMVSGLHSMGLSFNNTYTLEPRIAFRWKWNAGNFISLGYGKHSAMEKIHNYFARVPHADGSTSEPNRSLRFLKAHHVVLGYDKQLSEHVRWKTEVYYQYLYDLPVENNDSSYYSTLNEGTETRYVALVNKGTGRNYGVEMTLERFFANSYYFLVSASLFNSSYQSLEKKERNTVYNSNYISNVLVGKEWSNLGKKNNQVLSLNAKLFLSGGQRYIPLLRDASGQVSVNPGQNQFWDYTNAYNNTLDQIYQVSFFATYKWNKKRTTHELYINIDNLTNNTARLTEYYSPGAPEKVGYTRQFGFFPNLLYRVYLR
jgi:hypothetical protein